MFEQPPTSSASSTRGPLPGDPLPPLGGGPPTASEISPESSSYRPRLTLPEVQSAKGGSGGGRKRLMLIALLIVVLLGGGFVVASLLFPSTPAQDANSLLANRSNSNGNTNTTANVNTRTNTVFVNTNTNTTNAAANGNTNANANINAVTNTDTTNQNVNTAINTNTTNSSTNTNQVGAPTSYTTDSDGDALNNYLELWIGTSMNNADADGDGFSDGTEVTRSFSPLGGGSMNTGEYRTHCAASVIVAQYELPSSDVTTFCGIGSDLLSSVQVMASNTNPGLYEDLDARLSVSCTSFGKLPAAECSSATHFLLTDYLTAPTS